MCASIGARRPQMCALAFATQQETLLCPRKCQRTCELDKRLKPECRFFPDSTAILFLSPLFRPGFFTEFYQ
jgi:hypothetical protein